jgi:hypothetical protein
LGGLGDSSAISKPSLDEMWEFIGSLMRSNILMSNRTILTYDQVFTIYSKLLDIEQIIRELEQIDVLKKEIDKEKL